MNINKKLRLRLTVIATFISLLFFGDIIEAQVHHVKASTRRRTAVVVKNNQQAAAPAPARSCSSPCTGSSPCTNEVMSHYLIK